jgi:hypothetical protein
VRPREHQCVEQATCQCSARLTSVCWDEIALPLGLDVYIRLPEDILNGRLATMTRPSWLEMLHGFPLRLALDAMNRRSNISRALRGSELPHDEQRVYARNLEVPSGGAVGTARAIAHAYSVFATGGRELGLRAETLKLLAAPAEGGNDARIHANCRNHASCVTRRRRGGQAPFQHRLSVCGGHPASTVGSSLAVHLSRSLHRTRKTDR